jgi:hypothetical protein
VGDETGALFVSTASGVSTPLLDGGTALVAALPGVRLEAAWRGWLYADTAALPTDGGAPHDLGLASLDGLALGQDAGFLLGAPGDGGLALLGVDPVSAQVGWRLDLGLDAQSPAVALTDRGPAVVVLNLGSSSGPQVTEVLPEGKSAYFCAMPDGTPPVDAFALSAEHLFVSESAPDAGARIEAYPMPGVNPAASGWSGPRGSNARAGVPVGP